MHLSTVRGVGVVVRQGAEARSLRNTGSVYELANAAIAAGHGIGAEVARRGLGETVDLTRAVFDLPVSHPDPAHLHLTGTGLTHLGSASARDAMHAKLTGAPPKSSVAELMRMVRSVMDAVSPPVSPRAECGEGHELFDDSGVGAGRAEKRTRV